MAQSEQVLLPQPQKKGGMTVEEAIFKRRSERGYADRELTLEQISQILWAAQGITGKREDIDLRAAPSPGALYPVELYVLTRDGLFHYVPKGHFLEVVKRQDLREQLSNMASRQEIIKSAPMTIVIASVYSRVMDRFKERGKMYTHMEAGHIAQNVHLQAVALGLGSVPMGAFEEGKVQNLLSLPEGQVPIYMVPVGYVR